MDFTKASEERYYAYVYWLFDYYKGNLDAILSHVRSRLGPNTNMSPQRKRIKKYYDLVLANKSPDTRSGEVANLITRLERLNVKI